MSKKDLLGSGASFSSARRPSERSERGRAKALAQGDIPTYELVKHRLDEVSPTPLNPRRNFGSDEDLTRFGEELRDVQLAACVTVSRRAYLALWPEHASLIGPAEYVLVNGERRYRSARHVGLESLDFVVRDDLAKSREDFIDHLLAENLEREDFDVVERARGVAQLVAICAEEKEFGSKSRAAERLGKSPAWVTHQLALLSLPDDIQAMLSSGDLPERDGRVLARALKDDPALSSDELLDLLKSSKEREAQTKERQQAILRAATEPAEDPVSQLPVVLPSPSPGLGPAAAATADPLTAVKGSTGPAAAVKTQSTGRPSVLHMSDGVPLSPPQPRAERLPEAAIRVEAPAEVLPTSERAGEDGSGMDADDAWRVDVRKLPRVPWHDGSAVADLVFEKMDQVQQTVLLDKLLETLTKG